MYVYIQITANENEQKRRIEIIIRRKKKSETQFFVQSRNDIESRIKNRYQFVYFFKKLINMARRARAQPAIETRR